VWLAVWHRRRLPRGLWGAAVLSALGCFFVVRAHDIGRLDPLGLAAAAGAALTFAILPRHQRARRAPVRAGDDARVGVRVRLAVLGGRAAPVVVPVRSLRVRGQHRAGTGVVLVGTLLPFICMVASVRHIPAPRAAVVATLEPVLGAVIAYFVHGQALEGPQIAGGLAVVAAAIWIQLQRISIESETAPEHSSRLDEATPALGSGRR
jgi:drug/metabolite transporter (DMT)-like permease